MHNFRSRGSIELQTQEGGAGIWFGNQREGRGGGEKLVIFRCSSQINNAPKDRKNCMIYIELHTNQIKQITKRQDTH